MVDKIYRLMDDRPNLFTDLDISQRPVSFAGQLCHAGRQYFFLRPNGDVYVCSSMFSQQKGFVGNIREADFALLTKPIRCAVRSCNCGMARICGSTPRTPVYLDLQPNREESVTLKLPVIIR